MLAVLNFADFAEEQGKVQGLCFNFVGLFRFQRRGLLGNRRAFVIEEECGFEKNYCFC